MTLPRFISYSLLCLVFSFCLVNLPASEAHAFSYSLSIASDYGSPTPPVGVKVYQQSNTVFCSVDEYVQQELGIRLYCIGWIGSGSVPATGTTNTVHFSMEADSMLEWIWDFYYELTIECDYDIPCVPPLGSEYYRSGTTIEFGASLFLNDLLFDGYSGNGEISSGSAHYLTIEINTPSNITWFYRTADLTRTPQFDGTHMTVDNSPQVGKYPSIAINPHNGQPAIAYLDELNGYLKYAQFDGANWNVETADNGLLVGQYAKLIFDSDNSPVILYYSYGYRDLKIARKDIEGNWYNDLIDDNGFVGSYCDITNLPGARLGVSYYDETNGALLYREYQDGFWNPSPHLLLDTAGNTGTYTAIATNPITGEPGVAYRSETEDCVYFIFRKDGIWIRQKVTDVAGTGYFIDMQYDKNGTPYIVYQDNRNSPKTIDVYIAQRAGNVWINTLVQSVGDIGFYNAIIIDQNGYPHISFYDDNVRGLRYSFWNGRYWITNVIDDEGSHIGRFGALALDEYGLPHFVYWADETLRYAKATSWGDIITEPPAPLVVISRDTSGGGCFIATAAFGSYMSGVVESLCSLRDTGIEASSLGDTLVALYYLVSPKMADSISRQNSLRFIVRRFFFFVE